MIERSAVEQWLREVGLESDDSVEIDVGDPMKWYLAYQGGSFRTVVLCPDEEFDRLQMQVGVNIAEQHREILAGLSEDDRDMFVFILRETLVSKPVGYNLEMDGSIPARMMFGLNIWDDTVDKTSFMRRNHQLQTVAVHGVLIFRKLERFGPWWRHGMDR